MQKAEGAMGGNLRNFKNIGFFKESFFKSCPLRRGAACHKPKKCAPFYGRAAAPSPHIWEGLSEKWGFAQVLGSLGEDLCARVLRVFWAKVARARACA